MPQYPIRLHSIASSVAAHDDDDRLGESLVDVCRSAVERRSAPSSALVVRTDRVDVIPLKQLQQQKLHVPRFIAGMTVASLPDRAPSDVLAVGLIGSFERRLASQPGPVPVAMVFIEWTDCRWWHWHALVHPDDRIVLDATETVRSASEGDAKPPGLGGWWSLGRRSNMSVKLDPVVH